MPAPESGDDVRAAYDRGRLEARVAALETLLAQRIDEVNRHLDTHVAAKEHALEMLQTQVGSLQQTLANLQGRMIAVGGGAVFVLGLLELILRFVH